jgi:molybdopterin-guanine dinucleotide biosynthesis protein B
VLALCGFSGAGKTTALVQLLPSLKAAGLEVGVLKHDAHGVQVDQPGKDSDRLFRAGAQVLLRAPQEAFLRWHASPQRDLAWALQQLAWQVDLILVEGHKDTPLPKVWLEHPSQKERPASLSHVLATLPWGSDRLPVLQQIVQEQLAAQKPPLWGGVLMGGQSQRMGQPKQTLLWQGESLLARVARRLEGHVQAVAYLGQGPLPDDAPPWAQLPDPPGPRGPLAGMVAAFRWQPQAQWLFLPTDAVALAPGFVPWLASLWRPGIWGLQVRSEDGRLQPLFALLAPQLGFCLEQLWEKEEGPRKLASCPKVQVVSLPQELAGSLACVNTPQEWARWRKRVKE